MNTTIDGTPTCRASRMCSRVCGIGPSVAATTRIAPSICAAPGDHVLHVVRVPRAIDVRVVPVRRLVLHVRHRDRDPALALFRRVVDRIKRPERHLRVVLATAPW